MDGAGRPDQGLRHVALFYRDLADYAHAIADFLQAGAQAGEPALVAVPGVKHERLRLAIEQRRTLGQLTETSGLADLKDPADKACTPHLVGSPSGTSPPAQPGTPRTSPPAQPGAVRGIGATGQPRAAAATITATRTQATAPTLFADMSELGRNPARIMPAIQSFIDDTAGGQPIRFVGEPIWPGRTAAEICEATRHEALINLAFATTNATILCPYDTTELPEAVIADARRTHPVVISNGQVEHSQAFAGLNGILAARCDDPLPTAPADARVDSYAQDLRAVRTLIGQEAQDAGLPQARAVDLVLAVSEVAANTLRHTSAGGTITLWRANDELICQLSDTGHIADPLAGRRSPDRDHPGGQGLWLVNQVCDLVELRTSPAGTIVRLHMRLTR